MKKTTTTNGEKEKHSKKIERNQKSCTDNNKEKNDIFYEACAF